MTTFPYAVTRQDAATILELRRRIRAGFLPDHHLELLDHYKERFREAMARRHAHATCPPQPTLADLEREWQGLDAAERDELHAQFEDECLTGTADRLRFYPLLMRRTMSSYVGD